MKPRGARAGDQPASTTSAESVRGDAICFPESCRDYSEDGGQVILEIFLQASGAWAGPSAFGLNAPGAGGATRIPFPRRWLQDAGVPQPPAGCRCSGGRDVAPPAPAAREGGGRCPLGAWAQALAAKACDKAF